MNRFLLVVTCLLVSSSLLTSCQNTREEVEPVELTVQSGQLVVDCFISPQDTMITAKVTRSRPVLDSNPLKNVEINDALVKLTDGNKTAILSYDSRLNYYRVSAAKLPIREGTTYSLTVRTPDGGQVIAVSTVPRLVPIKAVRMDSTKAGKENATAQKRFSIVCTWQSSTPTTDFYQLKGSIQGISYELPKTAAPSNLSEVAFKMADNNSGLLIDKASGNLLSASAYVWDESGLTSISKRCRSVAVKVNLLRVDEAYYRYHEALDRQLLASTNPFAEPVLIPSNVQGGLGCFGSYSRSSLIMKVKNGK